MTDKLKDFSQRVKNEMTTCRYCIDTQVMTPDLAKDCLEVANAMYNNFKAIKAEGGFRNEESRDIETLENTLEDWVDFSKNLFHGVYGLSNLWCGCGIELEKED